MARVKGMQKIVGGLANASFYTIQGGDQVYVRMKGGPSKRAIKTKPQFEKLRRNNNEWKGCTMMGKMLRESYHKLNFLEDYPAIGSLNGLAKKIQNLDTISEHGNRGLYLSKQREIILGFSFSKKQVFENVLRMPLTMDLQRDTGIAKIRVPAFDASDHLYNFPNQPFFRLHFFLWYASDVEYLQEDQKYGIKIYPYNDGNDYFVTDWISTTGSMNAMNIELNCIFPECDLPDAFTMVLSAGVEFGKANESGVISGVKYCGCGKIMRVA